MHEYGLMSDVVALALARSPSDGPRRAVRVRVEVGEFAIADRESLETAYEILTRGTALETSALELTYVPGRAECPRCSFRGTGADLGDELSEPPALLLCPRCASPLLVTAGAGLALLGVQITDRGAPDGTAPGSEGRSASSAVPASGSARWVSAVPSSPSRPGPVARARVRRRDRRHEGHDDRT